MDSVDWINSVCAAVRDNSGLGSIAALPTPSSPSAAKLKCRKRLIHAGVGDCDIYPVAVSVRHQIQSPSEGPGPGKGQEEQRATRCTSTHLHARTAEASKHAVCREICDDSAQQLLTCLINMPSPGEDISATLAGVVVWRS